MTALKPVALVPRLPATRPGGAAGRNDSTRRRVHLASPHDPADAAPVHSMKDSAYDAPANTGSAVQGRSGLLRRLWRGWQERRAASHCCRRLLALYQRVAADHPELPALQHYRKVIALHPGLGGLSADEVLQRAKESFATWPEERELRFRDVVHFVAVTRLMAEDGRDRALQTDLRRVIDAVIPHHL